jgi:hypothetical protein
MPPADDEKAGKIQEISMQRTGRDGRKMICRFAAAWTIGLVIFAWGVF